MDNGEAAIENCEREAEAGFAPGANTENAAGADDLSVDGTVVDVDEDMAANAHEDADGEEVEGQGGEVKGAVENNDNAVQPLCS
ncbi:hypothetical protein FRC12_003191 [Ceratobasidium sp. 428]|nr:hypothetical protein FRC12_003191 [Ceratobasidium sp. 428]